MSNANEYKKNKNMLIQIQTH